MKDANQNDHEAWELHVFDLFVLSSGLQVVPGSIEKRKPPEPDIRCEIAREGKVTFELVELVDEVVRKSSSDTSALRSSFEYEINALGQEEASRFRRRYQTACVHFEFRTTSSLRQRRKGIAAVIGQLTGFPAVVYGPLVAPEGGFPGIEKVFLKQFDGVGPLFYDTKAYNILEPAKEAVSDKLHRHYPTSLPLELLAYYDTQPVLPASRWLPDIQDIVKEYLGRSGFRRVWVFDKNRSRILFVWSPMSYPTE